MTAAAVLQLVVPVLLVGLLGGLVARMGVLPHLLLALERSGVGRAHVVGMIAVAVLGIGITAVAGDPSYYRFRLTGSEVGLILFLVGIGLGGLAVARVGEYRQLRGAATTLHAAEPGDAVALTGVATAADDALLEAPLTGTRCLAYDVQQEVQVAKLAVWLDGPRHRGARDESDFVRHRNGWRDDPGEASRGAPGTAAPRGA